MLPSALTLHPPSYLRLSVTDRCNLRCAYCRPRAKRLEKPSGAYASDVELLELVRQIHRVRPLGKLRLTGGEPLLRPGLAALVRALRALLPNVTLALTTNGSLLSQLAIPLRDAGLDALNVSLDTLDPTAFAVLTRGGRLDATLTGIQAAQAAGFARLKLNCVLLRRINGDRLSEIVRWAVRHDCQMRFIELMPCGPGADLFETDYLSADQAIAQLKAEFDYLGLAEREGTAQLHGFVADNGHVAVGMIAPVSHPFCAGCNRLRMDAQGRLMACLRRENQEDLLDSLRRGDEASLLERIASCLKTKGMPGQAWPDRQMVMVGG